MRKRGGGQSGDLGPDRAACGAVVVSTRLGVKWTLWIISALLALVLIPDLKARRLSGLPSPASTTAVVRYEVEREVPTHREPATSAVVGNPYQPLFDALYQHESLSGTRLTGDGGYTRGPYHISRDYWTDGLAQLHREGSQLAEDLEDYDAHVNRRWASEVIMCAVWRRYEPSGYEANDFATCARLHNGGPDWLQDPATVTYWQKIKAILEDRSQSLLENGHD